MPFEAVVILGAIDPAGHSVAVARALAVALRPHFPALHCTGPEANAWHDWLGLELRVSVASTIELPDEVEAIHRRQPYSVLAAVVVLPPGYSLETGAHRLRSRQGRAIEPDVSSFERLDLVEKLYVAFCASGRPRFVDVAGDPPRSPRSPGALAGELARLVRLRRIADRDWEAAVAAIEAAAC